MSLAQSFCLQTGPSEGLIVGWELRLALPRASYTTEDLPPGWSATTQCCHEGEDFIMHGPTPCFPPGILVPSGSCLLSILVSVPSLHTTT